jgi:E3 ubiquitin-protein ligase CHFR
MCQVYFCGIGVQHRCVAVFLENGQPHGMSDVGDLIQSTEVYECFDGNAVEVEIMLDYLGNQHITPRHIYGEARPLFSPLYRNFDVTNPSQILQYILSQPRMFAPLIELDLFLDVHNVPPGLEPGIDAPRERICRMCATEVLLYGLKDWWVRERKKGFLDASVTERLDCPDGPTCRRQKEHGMFHFLHISRCSYGSIKCSTRERMYVVYVSECYLPCFLLILIGGRFAPCS